MNLKKGLIFGAVAALMGLLTIAFLTNDLLEKPGARLVDNSEGVDLTPLLKPDNCLMHLPWGIHEVQEKDIQKRLLYFCKMTYASGYDPSIRMPLWTSEILDISMLEHLAIGEKLTDYIDSQELPSKLKLTKQDFVDPYYIPGQMASPENMFVSVRNLTEEEKQEKLKYAMEESYTFTNTVPMVAVNLKNNIWLELELQIKKWLIEKKLLYVVTGPLFLNGEAKGVMGPNEIPIPTHFYKIVVYPHNYGSVSYIIPNKEIYTRNTVQIVNKDKTHYCTNNQGGFCTLNDFTVSMKELERVSGMTFFSKLAPHFATQLKLDINEMNKK